eukprot:scaffold6410_cov107-Isochrysis_galbana.AAC.2
MSIQKPRSVRTHAPVIRPSGRWLAGGHTLGGQPVDAPVVRPPILWVHVCGSVRGESQRIGLGWPSDVGGTRDDWDAWTAVEAGAGRCRAVAAQDVGPGVHFPKERHLVAAVGESIEKGGVGSLRFAVGQAPQSTVGAGAPAGREVAGEVRGRAAASAASAEGTGRPVRLLQRLSAARTGARTLRLERLSGRGSGRCHWSRREFGRCDDRSTC